MGGDVRSQSSLHCARHNQCIAIEQLVAPSTMLNLMNVHQRVNEQCISFDVFAGHEGSDMWNDNDAAPAPPCTQPPRARPRTSCRRTRPSDTPPHRQARWRQEQPSGPLAPPLGFPRSPGRSWGPMARRRAAASRGVTRCPLSCVVGCPGCWCLKGDSATRPRARSSARVSARAHSHVLQHERTMVFGR